MKLSQVIEELIEEKGLDRSVLSDIICQGLLSAYQKKYPDYEFDVRYDKKTDDLEILIKKTAVSNPEDENIQISLRRAKSTSPNAKEGDALWLPFEGKIGRIEILKAKQVIAQKIRGVEAANVYAEFKPKEGSIVNGVIHKCEKAGATIKIGDALAFLPKSLTIPTDKCAAGYPVRSLLKEVLIEPRNENQLILDRVSPEFVTKLFELEIPEVYEKIVEIKKIVRIAGYKSKIIVVSNDKNVDPVGTCVGYGGARIKPIQKELGLEKIDLIPFSNIAEDVIANSLKPASVEDVVLIDSKNANVYINEDQRSVAIGKGGQNISLASQLTGYNINLITSESEKTNNKQNDLSGLDFEG